MKYVKFVALALSLVIASAALGSCGGGLNPDATIDRNTAATTAPIVPSTADPLSQVTLETISSYYSSTESSSYTNPYETAATLPPASTLPPVTASQPAPVPTTEVTTVGNVKSPAEWTTEEILAYVTYAVNLTKAYTGPLTVNHEQKFTFNIESISPDLPMVKSFAQSVIDNVLKGDNETLSFNNGYAVNGDGETVPILLPKRQAFSLPAEGVLTASAVQSGDTLVVDLTLMPEYGTLTSFPPYNAGAIGYLNADKLDLSLFTVEKFDVFYSGSTIRFVIGQNGYVKSAYYNTPVTIDASGKVSLMSGGFKSSGASEETWNLLW